MRIFCFVLATICLFSEEKITTHTIALNGAPLHYTATVSEEGPVSYIAYVKDSQENRPITFVFNGGPGSSSCWLHLGAFGPRRLIAPEEGGSTLPPYQLIDNLETLLDVTDLVFIDPSDTGFSECKDEYFEVKEDIRSVGLLIRDYLTEYQRWNSPKYVAGESYGGIRGAGVAHFLQEYGIYLNGLILISPALDYQSFFFDKNSPLPYLLFLPTYATAAWYHGKAHEGQTLEAVAQKAREFAYGPYAQALLCPKCRSMQNLYPELCAMTGLSEDILYRLNGKISDMTFFKELLGDERKIIGRMDARVSGVLPSGFLDPAIYQIDGIFAGALHDYLHKELQCQKSYALVSEQAFDKWTFRSSDQFGYLSMMKELTNSLICNSSMKLFVGCGYFDLATPFASVEYCIDHIGVPNISTQVEYYEGGHMYYLNPSARIKFKQDLLRFYEKN